jgi:UDP-N-acetylmuramate: L-alanyl-gamma-D-glutamyl-meso-diaminopimelate ligase
MGSLAILARQKGYRVTGCDQGVYPPMSTQLEEQGIELIQGYDLEQLKLAPDMFVVGNAISRGNPLLEEILNQGLPYTSGPQFLADHVLPGKWVLAVSGTHGKTTTSSMLAWVLDYAGMCPGYLIGGVPKNFDCSARLGDTPFFVIEADEYDSAFFDKRSKFVHYRPRTLVINNLEFDHADIFENLAAIQKQFHHVVRTVPANGQIIYPANYPAIQEVLEMGMWSDSLGFSAQAVAQDSDTPCYRLLEKDGSHFEVSVGENKGTVKWGLTGLHNVQNALCAMLAARHVGVELEYSAAALSAFEGVKRRMDCLLSTDKGSIYDDFAHHPSAIATTLEGLRNQVGEEKILAIIEPRSNTMRMGVHEHALLASTAHADQVVWADMSSDKSMPWLKDQIAHAPEATNGSGHSRASKHSLSHSIEDIMLQVESSLMSCDAKKMHIVVMSNGGFGGIHSKLVEKARAIWL